MKVAKIDAADGRIVEILELEQDALDQLADADEAHKYLAAGQQPALESGEVAPRWFVCDLGSGRIVERPFKVLVLGADDVLEAVEERSSSQNLPAHLVDLRPLGGECDREPGRYRWNRELRQLEPLKRAAQRPAAAGGVSLERALVEFFRSCDSAGVKLPAATRAWIEQQKRGGMA